MCYSKMHVRKYLTPVTIPINIRMRAPTTLLWCWIRVMQIYVVYLRIALPFAHTQKSYHTTHKYHSPQVDHNLKYIHTKHTYYHQRPQTHEDDLL